MKILNKITMVLLILTALLLTTCEDIPQCLVPSQSGDLPSDTIFDCNQLLSQFQGENNSNTNNPNGNTPNTRPPIGESYRLDLQNDEFNGGVFAKDPKAFSISSTQLSDGTHSFSGDISISANGVEMYRETLNIASLTATNHIMTFGLTNPTLASLARYASLGTTDDLVIAIQNVELNGTPIAVTGIQIKKSFNIYDEYDLQGMRYDLDGGYLVKNDIPLTRSWEPVGTVAHPFVGSLKGDSDITAGELPKTISGLTISSTTEGAGLFGVINSAASPTVSNLIIKVADATTSKPLAITSTAEKVGVLAGIVKHAEIDFVMVEGIGSNATVHGLGKVGGLIGSIEGTGNVTIRALVRESVSIQSTTSATGTGIAGGLVGFMSGDTHTVIIKGASAASITSGSIIGGLLGKATGSGTLSITGLYSAQSKQGLTGNSTSPIVGGLIGEISQSSMTIAVTGYNQGTIQANPGKVGGIIGHLLNNSGTLTAKVYNSGKIISSNAGHIIGHNSMTAITLSGHYKVFDVGADDMPNGSTAANITRVVGNDSTSTYPVTNATATQLGPVNATSYTEVGIFDGVFTFGNGADDFQILAGYFPVFNSSFPYGDKIVMQALVGGTLDSFDVEFIVDNTNPSGSFLPRMFTSYKAATLLKKSTTPNPTSNQITVSLYNSANTLLYSQVVNIGTTWTGNKKDIPILAGAAYSSTSAYESVNAGESITVKFTIAYTGGTAVLSKSIVKRLDIYNEFDLQGLQFDLQGGYKVKNDIAIRTAAAGGIGHLTRITGIFTGSLKGDGGVKTISGLDFNGAPGLFEQYAQAANLSSPGIENLTFKLGNNVSVTGTGSDNVGILIGTLKKGYLKNITIDGNSKSLEATNQVGGIVGYIHFNDTVTLEDCIVKNITIDGTNFVGGAIGYILKDSATSKNITITAKVEHSTIKGTQNLGGTLGQSVGTNNTVNITSYNKNLTVTGAHNSIGVGGLAGGLNNSNLVGGLIDSTIEGGSDIVFTAATSSIGGLVGYAQANSHVKGYVKNDTGQVIIKGTNTNSTNIGGLAGVINESELSGYVEAKSTGTNPAIQISMIDNTTGTFSNNNIGGLVGTVNSKSKVSGYVKVTNGSSNNDILLIGSELSGNNIGGLVGYAISASDGTKIEIKGHIDGGSSLVSNIKIGGNDKVGGLVGYAQSIKPIEITGKANNIRIAHTVSGGGLVGERSNTDTTIIGYTNYVHFIKSADNAGGIIAKITDDFTNINGYSTVLSSSGGTIDYLGLIAGLYTNTNQINPTTVFGLGSTAGTPTPLVKHNAYDSKNIAGIYSVCGTSYSTDMQKVQITGEKTSTGCTSSSPMYEFDFDTSSTGKWEQVAGKNPILKDTEIDLDGDGTDENYFGNQ